MKRIVKLLRIVGGGTAELDKPEVSQKTRNWYTVLGIAMILVATMSASVAGFTWASVMHVIGVGIAVAMVWFFFSLTLNYMLASIIDAARGIGRAGILVSLVAILDADKEGFLRSAGSLIQTSP